MDSPPTTGYYRSDSVLRTDSVRYSSNIQEAGKKRGKKAKKTQVRLVQSRSGLQSHQSTSFDSGFATTEETTKAEAHPETRTVLTVKEASRKQDNVEDDAFATPRTPNVSENDGAKARSRPRTVTFKSGNGKARASSTQRTTRTISTSRDTRTSSTPPRSSRKIYKTEIKATPSRPMSAISDVTIESASWSSEVDEIIDKMVKAKKSKRQRVPPARKFSPRTSGRSADDSDSSEGKYNYSDDFEAEATDSDDFRASPYGVDPERHVIYTDYNRGPIYKLNPDGKSMRILTPTQNVYEIAGKLNYEADNESTESDASDRRCPPKKKARVIQVAAATPTRRFVHVDSTQAVRQPVCPWRPRTAATYRVVMDTDSEDEHVVDGLRKGKPGKGIIKVAPARPTTTMTFIVDYDADCEDNGPGGRRRGRQRKVELPEVDGPGGGRRQSQRRVETQEVDESFDDVEADISDPRTPYGISYDSYTPEDWMSLSSLSYNEPYRQKGLREYLESREALDGLNKDDLRLDLAWVDAENPTPRIAPTFRVDRDDLQRPNTRSVRARNKLLRTADKHTPNKSEKKEEGLVRKFFRRLRDAVFCCIKRQDATDDEN